MTTIPLWVVPKPHLDKLQMVVDQSAGEFFHNSYILPDDAWVHLDTFHVLCAMLLKVHVHHGNILLVLFRTDLSQVYHWLPMHYLWQLHQVVTIDSKHHVDNNNDFSNWGAGWIWVTFFGLVLWIAIFIKHILDLFAYVDDSFSWEFANNFTFYAPYHKFLPCKQMQLLCLFDKLGVPHDERKQVFGVLLTIIVDPNAMTITMPHFFICHLFQFTLLML